MNGKELEESAVLLSGLFIINPFGVKAACHTLGCPFFTFNNSICHCGKPTPGKPFSIKLGNELIRQRATHAVVLIFLLSFLNTNPVTRLSSTANCKRLDCAKLRSCNSAITAAKLLHLSASYIAQRI